MSKENEVNLGEIEEKLTVNGVAQNAWRADPEWSEPVISDADLHAIRLLLSDLSGGMEGVKKVIVVTESGERWHYRFKK